MSMQVSRSGHRLAGAAGVLAAGLLLAACGGGSGYGSAGGAGGGSSPTTTQAAQQAGGPAVHKGRTGLGDVLVDSRGMTLYAFAADSPGQSRCTDSCLHYWPVAKASGTPSHSADVTAKLATITRDDGTTQLTVDGWPAYTYAGDSGPGQATGQGLNLSGGRWWVLSPTGAQIKSGDADTDADADADEGVGGGY